MSPLFWINNQFTQGIALDVLTDPDDSARTMAILRHFGLPVPIKPLLEMFELKSYFQCYAFERNASITVQCNVLSTLLVAFERPVTGDCDQSRLLSSILKLTTFITDTFWTTNKIEDKWVRFLSFVLPSAHP